MIPAVRALARAAMAARPAPLADVQARAARPAPCDRSYLVPVEVFTAVAAVLTERRGPGGGFVALCVNGRRWFQCRAVYYDTPGLRSFHTHRPDRRARHTIREWHCADTGERQIEIALTGRCGTPVTHRRPLLPGDAVLGPAPRRFLASVLERSGGLAAPDGLRRVLETERTRAVLAADGQRLVCDAALRCRDVETGHTVRAEGGLVLVRSRTAGGPGEADRLLAERGICVEDFPVYCGGLAALRPELTAHPWGRVVRTVFPTGG
ncbi:VTC domain-containing protein [Streptomyces kronopolitis]|uniref:VTC domain-containing protein n=1 Tax=Streptomyces kronopolitis TaxID=1612435 RepID=A0ABQ2JVJ6_9ACTN|nr:hypothetical protein [Streptomyces kronopolitis]GGN55891.1 VTC domain-containing protein [Streptomyces kronopolitis]